VPAKKTTIIVIIFAMVLLTPGNILVAYGHPLEAWYREKPGDELAPHCDLVDVVVKIERFRIDSEYSKFDDDIDGEVMLLWKFWESGHEEKGGMKHGRSLKT